MMPRLSLTATRSVMLFALAALLACASSGCQCCAWSERYMDCVDHISDHEGHADVCYRPWYDLTRIGRVDWPWACCRKCPPPGFVYDTPVTHRVMARMDSQEQGTFEDPAIPAPPPLLPEDIWSQSPDMLPEPEDAGVSPLGPLFESDEPAVPPSPEPLEEAPPAPGTESLDPMPSPEARRQPAPNRREAREPTPALPRVSVSSEIDALQGSAVDWRDGSGVVRLFDDSDSTSRSPGIRVNAFDHSEYGPIRLDSWLSDTNSSSAATDAGVTTSVGTENRTPGDVSPTSAIQPAEVAPPTQNANWWEAATPPRTQRQADSPRPASTPSADDVFGGSGFAEWQPAPE